MVTPGDYAKMSPQGRVERATKSLNFWTKTSDFLRSQELDVLTDLAEVRRLLCIASARHAEAEKRLAKVVEDE